MKNKSPIAVIGASAISKDELEGLSCGDLVRLDSQPSDLIKLTHDGEVVALGFPVIIDDDLGVRIVKVFKGLREKGG